MAEARLARLPDWLIIGQESWDEVERRNQLLIRALAARNPGSRFLFAEHPLRLRQIRRWRRPRVRPIAPNIWSVRAVRLVPDSVSRELSDRIECAQLRWAVQELGLEYPYLWTQDPRAATLVNQLPVDEIVYDLTDDWAAFETEPADRARVQRRIEFLGRRAALVLACSRPLERGACAWSDRVMYLPNAVEPPAGPLEAPRDLEGIPRPRLGYAGTLHSARLDVDLLARAAQLQPSWSFVLLGPDLLEPGDRARLEELPNVHHLGVRPHHEVRSYLSAFDVCLLPNRVTEFTRSLDPLKLYEYLAAGRPVIVTPVGNAPELEEHIAIAATPEELVDRARSALSDDAPEHADIRRAAVADATWDSRAEDIERGLGVRAQRANGAQISAVIVSFNTRDMLQRCLVELQGQAEVTVRTVVVDNASTDGSVEMVRDRFSDVELIALDENVGFASANNAAFERCSSEYVLLLNSDAFLAAGALRQLVLAAERHPRAGAVGPRLLNPDGTLQRSAWPFPTAARYLLEAFGLHRPLRRVGLLEDLGTWGHDEERSVDFLIGACLLMRRDALLEVGGFDESYWLYAEEADLQRRLAARGWEVIFTPRALATHVGGASSAVSTTRTRHFYTGQMRFLRKHGGRASWPLARISLLIGALLRGRWSAARVVWGLRD